MISMLGCNTVRFQSAVGAALCGLIATWTFACASSAPPSEAMAPSEVVDVLVESSDGQSRVTLVGPESPVFTDYQESDPERIVIEMANVMAGTFNEAVSVYDGLVEEVRVEPLGDGADGAMTRVEIWLAAPADYAVTAAADGLVIDLLASDAMASTEGEEAWQETQETEDPWTTAADETMADDGMGETEERGTPMAAAPATKLAGVDARGVGAGTMVHLRADGSVESAVSFTLEDPARLVIDLPEMTSEMAKDQIEVGSSQVQRVRVGSHADKVRVVIDGEAEVLDLGMQVYQGLLPRYPGERPGQLGRRRRSVQVDLHAEPLVVRDRHCVFTARTRSTRMLGTMHEVIL
jgi:hypothetical protein